MRTHGIGAAQLARTSLRALRANRVRSALTMLGVIIGVAAVITMMAVGTGARRSIEGFIAGVGSNLLIVMPGTASSSGVRLAAGSGASLTLDDADAIRLECPSVTDVAPDRSGSAQLVAGNANWNTFVLGTTDAMLRVRNWTVASGRSLTDEDVRTSAKVCVLGATVAMNLFGAEDPVGRQVRIRRVPFLVAGVLEPKGETPWGGDQDDLAFVPVTTAQRRLFRSVIPGFVRRITARTEVPEDLEAAEREIRALLRQRHRISDGREDDFTIRNLTQILETAAESTRVMSLLLGAVASVSLLVGGIGIMNIMLVSVTERTREIGIRMAVGARRRDIRFQFLAEAMMLSLLGGVIGIGLGVATSNVLTSAFDWTTEITPVSIALSFGFSATIGVFFGFYPAWKASCASPIEALRYE
jgi:putative ABC transport system permease protein